MLVSRGGVRRPALTDLETSWMDILRCDRDFYQGAARRWRSWRPWAVTTSRSGTIAANSPP